MNTMRKEAFALQPPATEHGRSQKGSVLVEFAFILPVFLLLLFGVISFTVALYDKTVLAFATREGARAGAVYVANRNLTNTQNLARTTASQVCQNYLISFGADPLPAVTSGIAGDILWVRADYNYTGVYIWFDAMTLSSQTSMRIE